jgi:tripartite-type tricarboxylate transporter receptor subunit TctC
MKVKKLVISLMMLPALAFAQWQPTKPIEAIMAWTPGSVNELSFRVLAKEVEKNTGAKFVIVNRPGAGGVIGTEELSKKPADGYSVTNVSVPGIAAMDKVSVTGDGRSYTVDSFVYPTHIASSPFVVVAKAGDAVKNPKQLVQALKTEKVTIAASGGARLVYESLAASVKFTDVVRVDQKGPMDALNDVVGGHVRFAIVPSVVANPLYRDGRLQVVALSGNVALAQMADAQTMDTAIPNFNVSGMWALMLPAGTPKDVVDWYNREFTKAMKSEEVKAIFYDNLLLENKSLQTPEAMKNWVKTREKQWQPLVDTVLTKNNQK